MSNKPEYPKSLPALGTTQGIPVEQVGPLRVTEDGIKATFQVVDAGGAEVLHLTPVDERSVSINLPPGEYPGFNIISLDELDTIDPIYAALFEHHSGCSSTRGRDCICEYLDQWDA